MCGISNKLDGTENSLIRCSKELPSICISYGHEPSPPAASADSDDPFADLDSEDSDATCSSEDDCLMGEIITDDVDTYHTLEMPKYFI